MTLRLTLKPNPIDTRKTAGTAENPTQQQSLFYDIQVKAVIHYLQYIFIQYQSNTCDLEFDLSMSRKVKREDTIALTIYGLLLMVNSNIGPWSLYEIYGFGIRVTLTLTFQGHSRSNVKVSLDSHIWILLMFNSNIGPN